jgi:Domain of Unknown Function (DUF1080)
MKLPAPLRLAALLLTCVSLTAVRADDLQPEPGFVSLFNGKDLTGWAYTTNRFNGKEFPGWGDGAKNFDGKTATDDARYSAGDGVLTVHPRSPRLTQQIWTTNSFAKDFILRLEFRAATNADSGLFVRGPQLQVRDYLVAGPYKQLKQYKPQDWNYIEVTVKDGAAHCTCNGELLEDAMKLPAVGPIGLEGDRGQMEYRHIRIKEMP